MDWLENPDLSKRTRDPERQALNLCMKNFSFIIRFAIIAWEEHNTDELGLSSRQSRVSVASIDNGDSDPFTQSLLEVMYYIDALMAKESPPNPPWIQAVQAKALSNFSSVFEDLAKVFRVKDLGELARGFIESIPLRTEKASHMNIAKLLLVRDLVRGSVFRTKASRDTVIAAVIRLLQKHLNNSDDERLLSIAILKELVAVIQE